MDLRRVSRAGVIDNILRAQICDAAFVLVDLTHDNTGAYWEAGYAEGLNTPVIYLCEQAKFDMAKTHFDTRTRSDAARRSLNLFASSAGSLD